MQAIVHTLNSDLRTQVWVLGTMVFVLHRGVHHLSRYKDTVKLVNNDHTTRRFCITVIISKLNKVATNYSNSQLSGISRLTGGYLDRVHLYSSYYLAWRRMQGSNLRPADYGAGGILSGCLFMLLYGLLIRVQHSPSLYRLS